MGSCDVDRPEDLHVRKDGDEVVARAYREWPDRGPVINGRQVTIMTNKNTYRVNEPVRVVHVMEATEPGHEIYVMGPKEVFGEYVDGRLQGEPPPDREDPFRPAEYDGRVVKSPGIDFNFDRTLYSFAQPGVHPIQWQPGGDWRSNTLEIRVVE
jgi:hypothetical protein